MAVLEVKLKQHSPMIHFQHSQKNATIRATELKSKLEQYLDKTSDYYANIEGYTNEINKRATKTFSIHISHDGNVERVIPKKLDRRTIESGEYDNFGEFQYRNRNQKMIRSLYFGDVKEMLISEGNITVSFRSWDRNTLTKIAHVLPFLLAQENFGTRQNKGFGSFYISEVPENTEFVPNYCMPFYQSIVNVYKQIIDHAIFWFESQGDYIQMFKNIFYFYNALKSGINEDLYPQNPNPEKYYKSLLWRYINRNRTNLLIWEKRLMKQQIQGGNYIPDPLDENFKFIRVLLGFTPEYTFRNTNRRIVRMDEDYHDINGNNQLIINGNKTFCINHGCIKRIQSPITFKPIDTGQSYVVYIIVNPELYCGEIRIEGSNKKIDIRKEIYHIQKKGDHWERDITTIKEFDLVDFVKYACDAINRNNNKAHVKDYTIKNINNNVVTYGNKKTD